MERGTIRIRKLQRIVAGDLSKKELKCGSTVLNSNAIV